MMRFITTEQLADLRHRYPVGCRVRLLEMDDQQAPPIGTCGTVTGVDDTGSIMVAEYPIWHRPLPEDLRITEP